MGKIFVGQSKLTIELNLESSLVGVTSAKIKYKKPGSAAAEWTATIDDESLGIISYEVQETTEIDKHGNWLVWAELTFSDDRILYGETAIMEVSKVGVL